MKKAMNTNMNTNRTRSMHMHRHMISPTTAQSTRATAAFLVALCCLVLVLVPSSCTAFCMVHPTVSKNSNRKTNTNSMSRHRSPTSLSFAVTRTATGRPTATFKSMSMSIARKSRENSDDESATTTTTTTTTLNNEDDTDSNTPLMTFPTDDEELLIMQQSQVAQSSTSSLSLSSLSSNAGRMAQLQRWSAPVQKLLDDGTDGWALSAANLAPDSHQTINGKVFLATNIGYAVAGLVLTYRGDVWFGLMTDLAAIASFNYHYQQLLGSVVVPKEGISSSQSTSTAAPAAAPMTSGGSQPAPVKTPEMRLALLIDYMVAAVSILTGAFYLYETAGQLGALPIEAVQVAVLSLGCLAACWVWEAGQPYMIFHSLWHLFSAYAGYLIGNTHQVAQQVVVHHHHLL